MPVEILQGLTDDELIARLKAKGSQRLAGRERAAQQVAPRIACVTALVRSCKNAGGSRRKPSVTGP
jgi:hypothetical protein